MPLQWTDDLATGVETIDNQHKEIFRRIDALLEACREGKGRAKVGETIAFLGDYVVNHFADEEKIQRKYSYPDYPSHKSQHDKFIQDFSVLKKEFDEEGPSLGMVITVNRVVSEWLVRHIKKVDRAMAEYVKAQGNKG